MGVLFFGLVALRLLVYLISMTTCIYSHPSMLDHLTGPGHPECPERLASVLTALRTPEFQSLQWQEAPKAALHEMVPIHTRDYIERVLEPVPADYLQRLDDDTVISSGSGEAALRAAGAVCAAVKDVAAGKIRNAFCAVRPPGHHAEADMSSGFCLFNNVAIGAYYAQKLCGMKRVAVYDFDVHHGNGTQNMFWNHPDLLYISSHEWPHFPGTGLEEERGSADNILNIPLAAGTDSTTFRALVSEKVVPTLAAFKPDILLISAGFDAHRDDPLAHIALETEDYFWLGQTLQFFADQQCYGRMVSTLEGGYNLSALGQSVAAYVRAIADL